MTEPTESVDAHWRGYGKAMLHSMADVLAETAEDVHPVLLETADYWLSLGLTIGTSRPEAANRLLRVIESAEMERAELSVDADQFIAEVLE